MFQVYFESIKNLVMKCTSGVLHFGKNQEV